MTLWIAQRRTPKPWHKMCRGPCCRPQLEVGMTTLNACSLSPPPRTAPLPALQRRLHSEAHLHHLTGQGRQKHHAVAPTRAKCRDRHRREVLYHPLMKADPRCNLRHEPRTPSSKRRHRPCLRVACLAPCRPLDAPQHNHSLLLLTPPPPPLGHVRASGQARSRLQSDTHSSREPKRARPVVVVVVVVVVVMMGRDWTTPRRHGTRKRA